MRNMASNNGKQTQLKVKLIYDTEIRQWRYPISNHYESLSAFVKTSFHIDDFLLQYTDDEGDRLTIATDRDLKEAYLASELQFRRSLRIFVVSKESDTKSNPNSADSLFNAIAPSKQPIQFHWGSACNQCKTSPIQGIRYKCAICSNYDLCTECQSHTDIHDQSHPFIRLGVYKNKLSRFGVSVQNTHFVGLQELLNNLGLCIKPQTTNARESKPQKTVNRRFDKNTSQSQSLLSAELVSNLTLFDGSQCVMDSIQSKKWRVRNNGSSEWGYNVELVFVEGAKDMILNKRVSVSNCKPGTSTDISLRVKVPNKLGNSKVCYQLFAGKQSFGPKLCIDIMAIDKNKHKFVPSELSGNSDAEQGIVFQNGGNNGYKPKGRRLSMVLSKNVPTLNCICGEYLMITRPSAVYGNGVMIFCQSCGVKCAANDSIYHCAMDKNAMHPNGYDLCNKCYDSQLRNGPIPVSPEIEYKKEESIVSLSEVKKYKNKIEELRNVFPRFYFLSNDDMIRLIKEPTPVNVEKYLSILFEGIVGFVLDEDNDNIILGLRALNGESLRFGRLINVSKNKSLDKWLLKIEYQMKYSMSIKLEDAFVDYGNIENSEKYFEWICNYSTQIILITKRVLWCKTIEFFLNKSIKLHEALKEIKAEINLLSGYVYKLIKSEEQNIMVLKSKIGGLIQQLSYQRDVTAQLITQNVSDSKDEIWLSKMRTYYHTDDNMLDQFSIFKKLYIKCNNKVYYYGYEFYGDISAFIYTRTTAIDQLFTQLLQASIDTKHISNIYGVKGRESKSESLKIFAYDLGRSFKVFNSFQSNKISDITRMNDSDRLFNWFAGISSCGSFGIVKENDLSNFSGQISYYTTSITYHLKEGKNHMIINDKRIALHSDTRIFTITKQKYNSNSGQNNKIMQCIAMPLSNQKSIVQTLLCANGFQTAEILAKKVSMLLELCVSLYVVNAYDFGFGLILQICNECGHALIEHIQNSENDCDGNGGSHNILIDDFEDDDALNSAIKNDNHTNNDLLHREEGILTNSIVSIVLNILTQSDAILFESLMESAFPHNNIDWNAWSSEYVWDAELLHLKQMGFTNVKRCKEVLNNNNGNVETSMNEMFGMRM